MRLLFVLVVSLLTVQSAVAGEPPRARDLGVPFDGTPGPLNAITDVAGVTVGHATLIEDLPDGHAVRTGVTAVLPRGGRLSCGRSSAPGSPSTATAR